MLTGRRVVDHGEHPESHSDGRSVKYAVLFRERATRKQTCLTYASLVEAEQMAAVIEANGGDLRSAQRVMAVQRWLGHESIQTIVDRYSHLLPEQHAKSARMSDVAIRRLWVGPHLDQPGRTPRPRARGASQ